MSSVSSITIASSVGGFDVLELLPRLLFLEVGFDDFSFEREGEKYPGVDDFTDLDLMGIVEIKELLQLRGLRTMKATQEHLHRGETQEECQKRAKLLRQIEKLLLNAVTKPRAVEHTAARPSYVRGSRLPSVLYNTASTVRAQSRQQLEPSADTLTTSDIPKTEESFVRLCSSRPHDLFKWVQDAVRRLADVD